MALFSVEQCSSCKLCDPGSYQGDTGQAECDECEPGSHSSTQGATVCATCEAGHQCRYVCPDVYLCEYIMQLFSVVFVLPGYIGE